MGRYGEYDPHTVEYQIYRGEATDSSYMCIIVLRDKRIAKQWLRPHLMFPPSTIEGTASLHGLCYSVSLGVRNSGTACLAISGAEIVFTSKYTHHGPDYRSE